MNFTKISLFLLRVAMGWMFFYSGIVKILDPNWSATGYLNSAKIFHNFYALLSSPDFLPAINFVNEWGLTLLGVSLIFGIFVRFSSVLGALLMLFYYLPILNFPFAGANAFIVDQHIIFIFVLVFFAAIKAGRVFGLDNFCSKLQICEKFPKLRALLG